ncbi:MAG: AraC family ligand binding domain-containing protein [Turicibacter sp.]|nr:AraC family ligand binding domain-containing protein [Turicibacter sp.]
MKAETNFQKNPSQSNIDTALREVMENSNPFFPVRVHYTSHEDYRKNFIHPHWHREMEILYIAKGEMDVVIEDVSFNAKSGDIIVIPPKIIHGGLNSKNLPCDFYAIVFDLDFLGNGRDDAVSTYCLDPFLASPENFIVSLGNEQEFHPQLLFYINAVIEAYKSKNKFYETAIKGYLTLFFHDVHVNHSNFRRHQTNNTSRKHTNSHMSKRIIAYIESHYHDTNLNLEAISDYMGVTKEHFCRFFKKISTSHF